MKRLLCILLFVSLLVFPLGCQSGSNNHIRKPQKLNSHTREVLSENEEKALLNFIKELVDSYNQGDSESLDTVFLKTDGFDDAFTEIKKLAKENESLTAAAQKGFLIVMSASMGMINPGEDATADEVRAYTRKLIDEIIETYCN